LTRHSYRSLQKRALTIPNGDTLAGFFAWQLGRIKNEERRDRWEHAKNVVLSNDWSIKELKQMEDGVSPVYQRAVKNGISDGIARGFKNDLRKFKEDYRRIKEDTQRAAMALNQLGGVIPREPF
jgi:hypothetical protein